MNNMPVVTIVGRPNVGKSTLFNKLTKTRAAIVADLPGVTRDRQYGIANHQLHSFIIVDTGGLAPVDTDNKAEQQMMSMTRQQAWQAIDQSDLVLLLVDGQAGLTGADQLLMDQLRKQQTPLFLVINKADRHLEADMASEFYQLGIKNSYVIAAKTGRGMGSLQEAIFASIYPNEHQSSPDNLSLHTPNTDKDALPKKTDATDVGDQKKPVTATETEANQITDTDKNATSTERETNQTESNQITDTDKPAPATNPITFASKKPIVIAMLGRPNVGKSTLTNAMLGEERVMVCDVPGTTRDSISIPLQRGNKQYLLVDTAGIRRRKQSHATVEKFSVIKSMQAIAQADVMICVLDASTHLQEQDLRLLQQAILNGTALVVVYNKWDKLDEAEREQFKQQVDRRLGFTTFARGYPISALNSSGLGDIYRAIEEANRGLQQDFSTARLTDILEQAVSAHPPPLIKGRRIRLRYAHLIAERPLSLMIHGKQIPSLPQSYQRYLVGFFRKKLRLTGVILHLNFKQDNNPYVKDKRS